MKASVRRHGIVIRNIDVNGMSAKIGSGDQCEIRIEDPYLAAHVADLVQRNDGWHIVDAGTSLEGLTRGGSRIDDEKVVGGEAYGIGGFEILFGEVGASSGDYSSRATAVSSPVASGGDMVVPKTMVEPMPYAGGRDAPKTIVDMPLPPASAPSGPSTPQFVPLKTAHNMAVPSSGPPPQQYAPQAYAAAPAAPKKKRGLIVVGVIGAVLVLLLIAMLALMGGGESAPTEQAKATPTPQATAAPTPTPADPLAAGNQAAANLDLEKALAAWETAIEKSPSPELQRKYAQTAYEVALVYAAANDTARAREHLEKVTKFGLPDSAEVQLAKARLSKL